ncbi:MAG TPA: glycosyltransferase family 2 protein [Arsenicitalea sp.]|jgi:glycosyltransferase involved in cell wall biosynthesis|nr:glycosyltransferase family 2 protein [Arsenicitalea sp.]
MSDPEVTVLFSTYNGAKTLPQMLDALCKSTLPHSRWKLVAVDNNSTDASREILESYRDRLPLEVHFEPKQGKEHALALGFRQLEGELVILTDDDVIPEPDWIEQFLKLAEEQPDYDIFGGLIEPYWERPPAPWLLQLPAECMNILYALNGDVPEGPVPAGLIFGPSSAFRRSIVGADYTVHDGLGPNASVVQYPMGQDTAFALRLERQGAKAFHSRRPRLRHTVRANSMDEAWVLRRAERYGMGMVVVHPEFFNRKAKISGIPVSTALLWLAMLPVAAVPGDKPTAPARFQMLWKQAVRQGILRQLWSGQPRFAAGASTRSPSVGAQP